MLAQRVAQIAERVAGSEGLEVVEVEWKGGGNHRVLRIFIDKPEGVSLADCENISRQMSAILDVEDVIPVGYTLEISSPGLDRKLLKPADYERFQGKKVKVRLRSPIEGQRSFVGRLAGFQAGEASLEMEGGRRVGFSLDQVDTARLVVEF